MPSGNPAAPLAVLPKTDPEAWTFGKIFLGKPRIFSKSLSHFKSLILKTRVRDALVISVVWERPPVSFQMSHVSIVPKQMLPLLALTRNPLTLSKSHLIFVPEKYASSTSPVLERNFGAWLFNWRQISAVRRHCQTMARATGLEVFRSHKTV